MHAYVINLARSVDRREHMTAQLAKTQLDYQFVDAVDGRELDLDDARLFDPTIVGTPTFRPGAAGCSLSHLDAYTRALGAGLDTVLILEDDVVLPPDLNELADAAAQQMAGAEVILLNFHSEQPCRVTRTDSVLLPSSRLLVRVLDEGQPSSTGAYLITREACARMVDAVLPIRAHPDDWGFYHGLGVLHRIRAIVPMPVKNSPALRTTIDQYRPDSMQARMREALARRRVPILHEALTLRRNRSLRRWGWTGRVAFVEEEGRQA